MSHIIGTGYGDKHDWRYLGSSPWKVSDYKCKVCGCEFRHAYDDIPDIFLAMERAHVPEECGSADNGQ